MSKYLNLLFLIVLTLLLCSFTYAIPPIRTTISNFVGLDISYPQLNYYPNASNTNYTYFRWWVYNMSDGAFMTNSTVNCTFNLLDNTGKNTFRADMGVVKFGGLGNNACANCFNINISKTNFSYYGGYYYQIRCYPYTTGLYGGFISDYFAYLDQHSYNSLFEEENTDNTSGISVLLFMLFIIIGLFILGFVGKFNPHEIVNLVLQRGCIVAAIMLMMYTSTLLLNIVSYAHLDILKNEMIFLMTWTGWAGYIAAVYITIQSLFDILKLKKERRAKKVNEVRY